MSMQNKSLEYNVKQHGFCGFYYGASTPVDKKNVVIVVGGSEGNDNIAKNVSKMFAQRGIAAMGVCYFNVPGLPDKLERVPLDPFEAVVDILHKMGFEKIYIYGISKGGELALLVASLIPAINGVIALSPIHCVWGGMDGRKGFLSTKFSAIPEFTWKGKDFPCMVADLSYGKAIRSLICQQQFNLSYMYERPLKNFDEKSAIPVENIQGDILFIYPAEDTMWPSKTAVTYMRNRLKKKGWKYRCDVLEYEKASHIIVPLNPPKLKMFKVERKYPDDCRKSRENAFDETVRWIKSR